MISCCKSPRIQPGKRLNNKNIIATQPRYILFITIGAVLTILAYMAFALVHNATQNKHNIALANLQWQIDHKVASGSPDELEAHMRKLLPKLEELSHATSSSDNTKGTLATWQAQLGLVSKLPSSSKPWNRLWLAKRLIALGHHQAAEAMLAPLRKSASLKEPWGASFWSILISLDQLQGNREKGWQDLGEYKARFKDHADPNIELMINNI